MRNADSTRRTPHVDRANSPGQTDPLRLGRSSESSLSSSPIIESLRQASSWPVVRRASRFAVVVGAVLIAINHGNAIVGGEVSVGRVLQMGLTLLVAAPRGR